MHVLIYRYMYICMYRTSDTVHFGSRRNQSVIFGLVSMCNFGLSYCRYVALVSLYDYSSLVSLYDYSSFLFIWWQLCHNLFDGNCERRIIIKKNVRFSLWLFFFFIYLMAIVSAVGYRTAGVFIVLQVCCLSFSLWLFFFFLFDLMAIASAVTPAFQPRLSSPSLLLNLKLSWILFCAASVCRSRATASCCLVLLLPRGWFRIFPELLQNLWRMYYLTLP